MKKLKAYERVIWIGLFVVVILLNVKYVLCDLGIDGEYQIAMAYRIYKGDHLFADMWEPHQMSAFLCAFLMRFYCSALGNTGVVIFLQVCGVLLDGLVATALYYVMKKYLGAEREGRILALLFCVFSPKDMPLPEFANMEVWCSVLLFLTLFYLMRQEGKKKVFALLLAAVTQFLLVLSYPSCLVVYCGVGIYMLVRKHHKEFLIYTGICAAFGGAYLSYIFRYCGPLKFVDTIHNILALEESHNSGFVSRLFSYIIDFFKISAVSIILFGVSLGIVILAEKVGRRNRCKETHHFRKAKEVWGRRCIISMSVTLGMMSLWCAYTVFACHRYIRYVYAIIYVPVIAIGFLAARSLKKERKEFFSLGMLISLLTLLSTLLLTDLELTASLPYAQMGMLLAVYACLEYIKMTDLAVSIKRMAYGAFMMVGAMLIFRCVFLIRPISGQCDNLWDIAGRVKYGPAKNMISSYMGPYIQNCTYEEWDEYIGEGSAVYLVSDDLDTLAYLYKDVVIAAPTVMSTPTYNETILKYWESHPERYPDVIAVGCWYGELKGNLEESWILRWIEEEYQPSKVLDGKYWRYYFR